MKKMTIALLSIFVLINIAFAQQTTQQKVDSLQNEKAKAEKVLDQANAKLRQDPNPQNFQAVKNAQSKNDKVSDELNAALNLQRKEAEKKAAEEKAKKEAAERAKKEAEEKAKKEAEEKRMKECNELIKKKHPTFLNVTSDVKEYMCEELKKDPKWDILYIKYGGKRRLDGWEVDTFVIISTSGDKSFDVDRDYNEKTLRTIIPVGQEIKGFDDEHLSNYTAAMRAWSWHIDPVKYAKESVIINARPKFAQAVADYIYDICKDKFCVLDEEVEIAELLYDPRYCCMLTVTSGMVNSPYNPTDKNAYYYEAKGSLGGKTKLAKGQILVFIGCDLYDVSDVYGKIFKYVRRASGGYQETEVKNGRSLIDPATQKSKTFVKDTYYNAYYKQKYGQDMPSDYKCVYEPIDREKFFEERKNRKEYSYLSKVRRSGC